MELARNIEAATGRARFADDGYSPKHHAQPWGVSYGVITGDYEETGMIGEFPTLLEALDACGPRTNRCDGGSWEASQWPILGRGWFTAEYSEFDTGDYYSVSLHPPESITLSSMRRLARLLGAA